MLRRRAAFGVHDPVLGLAAESFRQFFRPLGKNVAEPGFAPRAALEQSFRRLQAAPFELQSVGSVGSEHAFFPGFECQASAASVVAARDEETVDSLRKIEDVVALETQVVKSILPFAAGVEVTDFSFVAPFA